MFGITFAGFVVSALASQCPEGELIERVVRIEKPQPITRTTYREQSRGMRWYDVVTIVNRTSRTVTYSYHWGDDRARTVTLRPGASWRHWWEFASEEEVRSPRFTIDFDSSQAGSVLASRTESYVLQRTRLRSTNGTGAKQYTFGMRGGRLDLFDPDR